MNYSRIEALNKVSRNANTKEVAKNSFIVEAGSIGNHVLDAMDFLNKEGTYYFRVTTPPQGF